jgi:hypothetical protein
MKFEIKSASYIQSWYQRVLSKVIFRVGKTRGWEKESNKLEEISKRQADYYIFAVYKEEKKENHNPWGLNR